MIRIAVSAAAYAVIRESLPGRIGPRKPQEAPGGGFFLWLDETTVNQLAGLRGRSEGFSEAILRLAEMEAA